MMTAAHVGMHLASTTILVFALWLHMVQGNPLPGRLVASLLPCAAYPVFFIAYFSMYCLFYEWWSTPRRRRLDWWLAAIGCVEVATAIWLFIRFQIAVWASV